MRRAAAVLICLGAGVARAQDLPVAQVNWRYDEDWSILRDQPVAQGPWWLPAKYRPLDPDGSAWISTGVDARARYEGFRHNVWGSAGVPDEYLWLRVMPHADIHVGPARAFVQAIVGDVVGLKPAPAPVDKTGVDLLQAFAEVRLPIGAGSITLRGGRELMALGSERLVGTRYGPNIPLPFDGVRAMGEVHGVGLDLFRLRPVRTGPRSFDDRSDMNRRLTGLYVTIPLRFGQDAGLDAYRLDYRNAAATFDQGEAREKRRTWGLRFHGSAGEWTWNWEAMLQRGSFGDERIRAWSIASETGRAFPNLPLKPVIRLRANIASGDANPADKTLGTFNPLFPKGKYFGELSPIGPYNIMNLHPAVALDLGSGVEIGVAGVAYWRQSRHDGVYDVPGQIVRSGADSRARFIGKQAEGLVTWQVDPALSLSASYSLFDPGRFVAETGPSKMIHMVGLETQYRF